MVLTIFNLGESKSKEQLKFNTAKVASRFKSVNKNTVLELGLKQLVFSKTFKAFDHKQITGQDKTTLV